MKKFAALIILCLMLSSIAFGQVPPALSAPIEIVSGNYISSRRESLFESLPLHLHHYHRHIITARAIFADEVFEGGDSAIEDLFGI